MKIGGVYRIQTILTKPPKEKIVLHVGDDLFIWFNTEARQRPNQLEVKRGECPEIVHTSYLDCSRLTTFSDVELKAAVFCGEINAIFAERLLDEIEENAKVLIKLHRTLVSENLRFKYHITDEAPPPSGALT